MDYGILPPEVNSSRIYAGPGSGPMLAAASAWDGLAAELGSAASGHTAVIAELTHEANATNVVALPARNRCGP